VFLLSHLVGDGGPHERQQRHAEGRQQKRSVQATEKSEHRATVLFEI
jgi:hypothetical protein